MPRLNFGELRFRYSICFQREINVLLVTEPATGGVLSEKVLFEISQNSQENIRVSLFFNKFQVRDLNFIKKETLAQVFSCEFCEISKNIFLQNASTAPVVSDHNLRDSFSIVNYMQ